MSPDDIDDKNNINDVNDTNDIDNIIEIGNQIIDELTKDYKLYMYVYLIAYIPTFPVENHESMIDKIKFLTTDIQDKYSKLQDCLQLDKYKPIRHIIVKLSKEYIKIYNGYFDIANYILILD